jgi:hypothetical protein
MPQGALEAALQQPAQQQTAQPSARTELDVSACMECLLDWLRLCCKQGVGEAGC